MNWSIQRHCSKTPVGPEIKWLPHGEGLELKRATEGSSGYDLQAAVNERTPLVPGETRLIPMGFCLAIPPGFEGQVRSRSGLALKKQVISLNSPGTIDSDFRGELGVILHNMGHNYFYVNRGDRIAQLVFCPIMTTEILNRYSGLYTVEPHVVEEFSEPETSRGSGRYGSTGV